MSYVHTLDDFPDTLAGRIRKVRALRNMMQIELAQRVGVSPLAIKNIENHCSEPKVFTAAQIAKVLGVSLDYLVFGDAA